MSTNGGKKYFYSMGAARGDELNHEPRCLIIILGFKKAWPLWAREAYSSGYSSNFTPPT